MALTLVITDAGRAALVNARNDGTNAVRIASAGVSATAIVASPAATTLPGESKRVATISGGAVARDVIHLVVQDETMDSYTLRSFALYLDNGVLFALYGQATPIIEKSAQALMLLAIDVTLQDVAAGQITFGDANFLQPPATVDRTGVVELATEAEATAGTDRTRAITPYTLRVTYGDVWRASNDGAGSGLDADLLDGRHGAEYALLTGALFSGTVEARGFRTRSIVSVPVTNALSAGTVDQFVAGESTDNAAYRLRMGYWYTGSVYRGSIDATSGGIGTGLDMQATGGATRFGGAVEISSSLTRGGSMVWDAGNDGAGSGLDADLLDGLHAADFIRRNAGGRPVEYDNGAGQMFIGTDTGGWDVGYRFRDTQGSTLGAFGATGGGNSLGYLYVGPSYVAANALRVYPDRVTWGASAIWHAANDGAGSGLDADLLDGLQASQLLRSDQSSALARDASLDFVNSAYGLTLRVGGNGYTAAGSRASIVTTNGNLHLDATNGFGIYLNHFAGDGVNFGNGASSIVAHMSKTGALTCAAVDAPGMRRNGMALVGFDNDGAGSGLDADLLDGRQGSEFALLTGAAFTGSIRFQAAEAMRLTGNNGYISFYSEDERIRRGYFQFYGTAGALVNDGAGPLHLQTGGVNVLTAGPGGVAVTGGLSRNGNNVWDVGNDGAGSGMDADMVDGWHRDDIRRWGNLLDVPGAFPPAGHAHSAADIAGAFPGSLSENGYTILPNGLILQWVTGALMGAGQETTQLVYFPVAFPNACFGIVASTRDEYFSRAADVMFSTIGAPATDTVTVGRKQFSGSADDQVASRPFIVALGR